MSMARRNLGNRQVNPVGFGAMNMCWAYGPALSETDAYRLLHGVLDAGYDHIDTANIYGMGQSETHIGNALRARRKEYYLATKMAIVVEGPRRGVDCSPAAIMSNCEASLKRLQTDHIDLYYMHRRDFTVPIEESAGAMAELVKAGKIGGYGLSEMSAATIRAAHAVHPVTAVQNEYSLMTRQSEIGVLAACAELGITFVAFSPVARGFLSNHPLFTAEQPQWLEGDLRGSWPRFNGEAYQHNWALAHQFNAIATEEGVTPAQLALGWVHAQGPHVVSIPGTQNFAHMQENIARWDYLPTPETCARLDALINRHTVAGPRYTATMQPLIDTEEFAD